MQSFLKNTKSVALPSMDKENKGQVGPQKSQGDPVVRVTPHPVEVPF